VEENILTNPEIAEIRNEIKEYIDSCPLIPEGETNNHSNRNAEISNREMNDVYAKENISFESNKNTYSEKKVVTPPSGVRGLRFIDAIKEALHQSMLAHPNLILMGQDIAEYGGAFKITEGLLNEFGKERVRNTPLCESAIVGTSLGLSLEGFKSVMEMQFADFVTVGFNQVDK